MVVRNDVQRSTHRPSRKFRTYQRRNKRRARGTNLVLGGVAGRAATRRELLERTRERWPLVRILGTGALAVETAPAAARGVVVEWPDGATRERIRAAVRRRPRRPAAAPASVICLTAARTGRRSQAPPSPTVPPPVIA